MPDLKLGKLPDRQPVKIAFKASPELAQLLHDYALAYREAYGQEESVEELVPFILTAFLESDRGFAKARKDKLPNGSITENGAALGSKRRGRAAGENLSSKPD
ncbi:MAG TPA: DUF2274 domain-containing protein [Stellaceae bacterium]|nr:DUF2274 domain-containing protein [Stellaceae bacterium]